MRRRNSSITASGRKHLGAAVLARLRSVCGESIGETLVAILIVTLATVLFATMVGVATSTARKSENAVNAVVSQTSELDASTSAASASATITSDAITWNNGSSVNATLNISSYSSIDSINNQTIARFVLKK